MKITLASLIGKPAAKVRFRHGYTTTLHVIARKEKGSRLVYARDADGQEGIYEAREIIETL